ncbi:MAG: dipeptidyl aminopeptidase [Burkholderiales bacterium]|nr:dipeptidyl aminopeptidase [Burkholderiales bacterium]
MKSTARSCLVALLFVLAALPARPDEAPPAAPAASAPLLRIARDQVRTPTVEHVKLPGAGRFGSDLEMAVQVFKPEGNGPFPVVLFSHGRAPDAADRAKLAHPVSANQVRYWLEHGIALVAPIRPGYGITGGPDAELTSTHFDTSGHCSGHPDFHITANAAVKTVVATLAWLRDQPWADKHHVLLVGQSVGGLTTVAAAAQPLPGVIASINFAGGTGGNPKLSPGRSCEPEQLGAIYAEYGKTTTRPNLWIYAENDQYWGPDAPVAWHEGFAAGGSASRFVHAPPVADGDGHGLSRHAAALWAPYLDDFLASIGWPGAGQPWQATPP